MAKQKTSFTKSFEELEKIVARLETGTRDLDEVLGEFEQGLALVQELKEKLKEVENKVVVLKKKFSADETPLLENGENFN